MIRRALQRLKTRVDNIKPNLEQKKLDVEFKIMSVEKNLRSATIGDTVELQRDSYPQIHEYMQKFFNSGARSGRPDGQNLTFVVGAEGSGKSRLIREQLEFFTRRKKLTPAQRKKQLQVSALKTPQLVDDLQRQLDIQSQFRLVLTFDFEKNYMMRPEALFHHLESKIMGAIIETASKIEKAKNVKVLDPLMVKQIVLAENAPECIFIMAKDVIYAILENKDVIRLKEETLAKLEQLNQQIVQISHSAFFSDHYFQVVQLISQDLQLPLLQSCLLFFLRVFKTVEQQHRPAGHTYACYQSGTKTTQYLFSVLNYLCGFGRLNQRTLAQVISSDINPYKQYYISQGNHVDVVMVFMHMEKLACYNSTKLNAWLDNLIVGLHNLSNIRTHFPVILEMASTEELWQLQKMGRLSIANPSVVEVPGYFTANLHRYSPSRLFSKEIMQRLFPVLGRNPSTWTQATLALSAGVPLQDLINGSADFLHRGKTTLQSRLNKVYLQPEMLPHIDDNTLKLLILQTCEILWRCNGMMHTELLHIRETVHKHPVFRYLNKSCVLYEYYYNLAMNLADQRNVFAIREQLQQMSVAQRVRYKIWRNTRSPFIYTLREIRYSEESEKTQNSEEDTSTNRADYQVRESFGQLRDYRVNYYDNVLKQKYNV